MQKYSIMKLLDKVGETMYIFNANVKINKTKASEKIGISRVYLTNILNSKQKCSKVIAYCITKYLDSNAEISDYFRETGD